MGERREAISIIGATGMLGGDIARQLLAAGHHVVAVTRDPARAGALAAAGAEVRVADLADTGTLRAACRGADVVVAAAHAMLGRGRYRSERVDDEGHRALIDAARAEGVRRFVYTSVLGASPDHPVDFWRTKHGVEQCLKASGLSWTILRPAAFMEMHAHELIGKSILAGGTATILGAGDRPMNFVAVRDVARVAARAAVDPSAAGRTIEVGGPENLTQNDVAALYGRLCGRTQRVRHVPAGALRVLAALAGPLHPGIARVMRASVAGASIDQAFTPVALPEGYPAATTRLEDVARERIDAR
ncbi:MAG: NmrA family NAD(P)-binding protein [Acidobacteria bacterium]|nr:NmrA family NAD(P)-binding protein [Acidobacteriota bacterium]